MISQLQLTNIEVDEINTLLGILAQQFKSPEEPEFLHNSAVFAHDLPLNVRLFINNFRLKEAKDSAVCVISGYPINPSKIGLTPLNRSSKSDLNKTLEEQMLLVLLGSLLGEPVAWSTQQAGHIVHDISPVKGQECDQTGSSSKEELFFHTEDAFHPYHGDYLGMMCLRNNQQAATSIASNQVLSQLTTEQIRILFEPRFVIRPDASQFEKHNVPKAADISERKFAEFLKYSEAKIHEMNTHPQPTAILFGDHNDPYICVDCSVYMDALDAEAEEVIQIFNQVVTDALVDLELKAGEICFVDNYRAVHGRKPFKYPARYDGSDRWLKRINVTRDIRKSRDMRMTSTSRIIF